MSVLLTLIRWNFRVNPHLKLRNGAPSLPKSPSARHPALLQQCHYPEPLTLSSISEVRGHGRQKGHTETYRGREYSVDLLPKIKIESVMNDKLVDAAVAAILQTAATGRIGDGKTFLTKVEEAIRIRNQESGVAAL
jgi:nitrogen regulatory protein P-II 1